MPTSRGRSVASQPDIGQAPGDLATLQAFVNTLDIEEGTDLLSTPDSFDRWLQEAGLLAGTGGPVRPGDLAMAVELREALRGVLRSHVAHSPVERSGSAQPSRATEPSDPTEPSGPAEPSGREAASRVANVASALQARLQVDTDGR